MSSLLHSLSLQPFLILGAQVAVAAQHPVRISLGFPQMLLLAATAHQWHRALRASSLALPAGLEAMAPSPPHTLLVLVDCPYVQATVLSAEAPAHPLLQLSVGEIEMPISLTVEKPNPTMPLAVEAVVPFKAGWYHPALFSWEPLVEPIEVALSLRSGPKMPTAVNLHVGGTVDVNLSDKMLRYAQSNLRAAFAAFEAAVLRDVATPLDASTPARVANVTLNLATVSVEEGKGKGEVGAEVDGVEREAMASRGAGGDVEEERGSEGVEGGGTVLRAAIEVGGIAVPCWVFNQTGATIECWAEEGSGEAEVGERAAGEVGRAIWEGGAAMAEGCGAMGEGDGPRGDDDGRRMVGIAPGVTQLVDLWRYEGRHRSMDWHEDSPRAMAVRVAGGWKPLRGVLVNLPGTVVLPLEARGAAEAEINPAPRSLVCEVRSSCHVGAGIRGAGRGEEGAR